MPQQFEDVEAWSRVTAPAERGWGALATRTQRRHTPPTPMIMLATDSEPASLSATPSPLPGAPLVLFARRAMLRRYFGMVERVVSLTPEPCADPRTCNKRHRPEKSDRCCNFANGHTRRPISRSPALPLPSQVLAPTPRAPPARRIHLPLLLALPWASAAAKRALHFCQRVGV